MKKILFLMGVVCMLSGCTTTKTSIEKEPVSFEYYHKTLGKQAIESINKDDSVPIGKKQIYNDLYRAMTEYFEKQK
jgi:uncharacterized lipoprotein YajG